MTSKNTNEFKITVVNSQTIDGHTDKISETACGSFRMQNGKAYVIYKSGGSSNMLKIDGDTVTLRRTGEYGSQMQYKPGKHEEILYRTPYGVIKMGLFTRFTEHRLSDDGGTIRLGYVLQTNGDKLYNDMIITIER
ncbi:MAG: DUF1934 domain-containing protein [Candidatus Ornithomonoglobus sp.]